MQEKKLQAMEAAKKAKNKNKKKGKADEDDDEKVALDSDEEELAEEHFDLESQAGFIQAMRAKIPMPFMFGPIEFSGLNN